MARYLSNKILHRLTEKKHLLDKRRPLPTSVVEKLKEQMIVEWTYNTNSIEGNTLTLKETRLVLEQGITIAGKSLREHFEATNHQEAIFYLEKLVKKARIYKEDILKFHSIISKNIEKQFAGRYRNGQVRILGSPKLPPNYMKIPSLIKQLINWINKNPEKLHIVELAALAHYQLVAIHPFFDGNGRTARLLMNLILMQKGYPASIVLRNDRKRYYNALHKADKEDYQPFVLLMAQAVLRSLDVYLRALGKEAGNLVPLEKLAKKTPYSADYLSLLARRGELEATKVGRNWFSSLKAIKEYREKRERKR